MIITTYYARITPAWLPQQAGANVAFGFRKTWKGQVHRITSAKCIRTHTRDQKKDLFSRQFFWQEYEKVPEIARMRGFFLAVLSLTWGAYTLHLKTWFACDTSNCSYVCMYVCGIIYTMFSGTNVLSCAFVCGNLSLRFFHECLPGRASRKTRKIERKLDFS